MAGSGARPAPLVGSAAEANKGDKRRQKRRRQQQAARDIERQEWCKEVEAAIQGARTAMKALRGAAENDQVTPAEFVQRVTDLLSDEPCATILSDADYAKGQGSAMAEAAGEDRSRALAAALTEGPAEDIDLWWLAAGFADGAEDVDLAEKIVGDGLARLGDDDGAADMAVVAARVWLSSGRLGDARPRAAEPLLRPQSGSRAAASVEVRRPASRPHRRSVIGEGADLLAPGDDVVDADQTDACGRRPLVSESRRGGRPGARAERARLRAGWSMLPPGRQ